MTLPAGAETWSPHTGVDPDAARQQRSRAMSAEDLDAECLRAIQEEKKLCLAWAAGVDSSKLGKTHAYPGATHVAWPPGDTTPMGPPVRIEGGTWMDLWVAACKAAEAWALQTTGKAAYRDKAHSHLEMFARSDNDTTLLLAETGSADGN